MRAWERGEWRPYTEEELIDLLAHDLLVTPAYTRVSRMIRDISSTDIVCGNKKTNLRQMVEAHIGKDGGQVSEIRMREVATSDVAAGTLSLECVSYETTVSQEHFLEWVSETDRIAGFLRLSLPKDRPQAMIREVHVYGRVAGLHRTESGGAQHQGLGKELVERACAMAREAGYEAINVISAVGTRNYYRALGFSDADLYQRRRL
jgi:elongator complex protein 3